MSENINIRNSKRNREISRGKLPLDLPQPRIRYRSSRYNPGNRGKYYDEETEKTISLFKNIVICAVVLLLVFILKSIDTPLTRNILGYVKEAVTTDFDIDESLGKLKFVDNLIPDEVKAVFNEQSTEQDSTNKLVDNLKQSGISFTVPAEGKVIGFFGEKKREKSQELNTGIDIQGNKNDNIYAVYDGYVSSIGEDETGGKYIKINQGNNIITIYMGCSEFIVDVGYRVKKGQQIGKMGRTEEGIPVLHFETWVNDKPIDPLLLMDLSK